MTDTDPITPTPFTRSLFASFLADMLHIDRRPCRTCRHRKLESATGGLPVPPCADADFDRREVYISQLKCHAFTVERVWSATDGVRYLPWHLRPLDDNAEGGCRRHDPLPRETPEVTHD